MRIEQQIEYEAADDAEAIAVARERLGREAVILASRRVRVGGVLGMFRREVMRVTAGILVPEQKDMAKESRERMAAFQHLLEVRRAVSGTMEPAPLSDADEPLAASAFAPPLSQSNLLMQAAAAAQAFESGVKRSSPREASPLAKDVDEIRSILTGVLERLGSEEKKPPDADPPLDENAMRLVEADVDRGIAIELSNEYREASVGATMPQWLAGKIPIMGEELSMALGGKRVLFAGPTGVGKTTTIAKIAAAQSLWENKKVVLITADTYRIAAVEQLRTYAKILGIPLEIAAEPGDISNFIMKKHKDADLVLLDTAGRSHYEGNRMEELKALYDAFSPDSVHLVIAANIKYRDMLNVIDRMGVVPLSALIFTKLDETATYGTILNVLRDFNLPISFFTMGQNVPNDIEVAKGERLVSFLFERRANEK